MLTTIDQAKRIAIELGDTYSGHDNRGSSADTGRHDAKVASITTGPNWPRPKCLALIPQAYAMSLAYGRNIITGAPSPAGQWLVRNRIVWHRPNPAVGALGDKFRPCTSYITVATRSAKRWFDLTAVRTAPTQDPSTYSGNGYTKGNPAGVGRHTLMAGNAAGAPPLDAWFDEHDTWTVTTQPSSLAHYAMWPARLAERLILSMCPVEVCPTCGEPRRRIERAEQRFSDGTAKVVRGIPLRETAALGHRNGVERHATTLGWTDCGCGDPFVPGVVLDPFAGTGTTLAVADLHGRDAIGIDIDPRNRDLYPERRAECARNLFGTRPEMPGQLSLMEAIA